MASSAALFRSQVGKKALMGLTGIVLFGFVLLHMLGNLKVYLGAEDFNHYAEWLREFGTPLLPHSGFLWILRLLLLIAVGVHILAAYQVTRSGWMARPQRYGRYEHQRSDYASRTIRWGGVIIALFVFYHLAHFTWGWSWAHPSFVVGDPYQNLVVGFRNGWISALYILAQVFLGLHLYHGLWSLFQSLGWSHPRFNSWRRHFARSFALMISMGNISFPLAVLTGVVQ
jgi:succinate dehydrogenase / fumarate reductase cytochrome b subunit